MVSFVGVCELFFVEPVVQVRGDCSASLQMLPAIMRTVQQSVVQSICGTNQQWKNDGE